MSNIFALLGRLTVIFIAYLAALIAGGLFFTLALTGVLEPGATASPPEDWLTILPLAGVVTATAGSLAFIPFLAAMFASEYFSLRGFVVHLAAGAALGLAVIWLRDGAAVAGFAKPVIVAVAAGAVAGFVYWLLAGRNAGKTFARIVNGPESSGS